MTGKVGTRSIIWAGGEHDFCLAETGSIFALQDACGAGIMAVMRRLEADQWRLEDVREPIRLGLMGGGLSAERAMQLVKLHVDGNPRGLAPSVLVALAVIEAVIVGVPGDPVGKTTAPEAATDRVSSTTTVASDAAQSLESRQL